MNCEKCRFWEEDKKSNPGNGVIMGYCRESPPAATVCLVPQLHRITGKMIPTIVEVTVWSKTMANAWCGGFEPKKKPLGLLSDRITNDRNRKTPKEAQESQ
jgi:hypothetical protein